MKELTCTCEGIPRIHLYAVLTLSGLMASLKMSISDFPEALKELALLELPFELELEFLELEPFELELFELELELVNPRSIASKAKTTFENRPTNSFSKKRSSLNIVATSWGGCL
jgi:hypothetical protein